MSWQKVKMAFFVTKNGKCTWIDIGLCSNCAGIHIPAEEANGCNKSEILTYEQVKEKFGGVKVRSCCPNFHGTLIACEHEKCQGCGKKGE